MPDTEMMNKPNPNEYQAKYGNYGRTDWVLCPYCGKRQFPLTVGAIIKGQFFQCKASTCKRVYEVNTDQRATQGW